MLTAVYGMNANSIAKSVAMLKAVLSGATYQAVAKQSGLSRSAVELRVKKLARDLQRVVGVEGVDEEAIPTVTAMRAHKGAYLEALDHYQPERALGHRPRHAAITDGDLDWALAITRQRGGCGNRDAALLLVLFATAARPLEIARLEVADYLNEDGSVREESVMRAAAAINGRERPLFFASRKMVAAIDWYLEERLRQGHGTHPSTTYRGLDPTSRLFLTEGGQAMPIRIQTIGNRTRHLCSTILSIYRKIFARAGLRGVSALCARRTVAQRLTERGCDLDEIGAVLGVKDRSSLRNLLVARARDPLKARVRELV